MDWLRKKQKSPDHLLGIVLEFERAKLNGDSVRESEVLTRLKNTYAAEMLTARPEYEAHRVTIDKLYALTDAL